MLRYLLFISFLGHSFAATSGGSSSHTTTTSSQCVNQTKHTVAKHFGDFSIYKYYDTNTHEWIDSNNHTIDLYNCTQLNQFQLEIADIATSLECLNSTHCIITTHTPHAAHDAHTSHKHPKPPGQFIIIYISFILLIGCLSRYVIKRLDLPVQYTVVLLGIGMLWELIEFSYPGRLSDLGKGGELVRTIDPHMILFLFIPALIFESAFSTDYHTFVKEKEQAALLAGPGVILNTILTGGVMHYFNNYNFTWSFSFMVGAILSATDPVAVVALLKELGASKRLSTLIEAESLLNDGTAFVAFTLLQEYAASSTGAFDLVTALQQLIQLALCGALWGIASGLVTYKALGLVFADFQVEITITLVACYISFYAGEAMIVSGVLAVVFLGLVVSRNRSAITPAVEETMHGFWEMIGFVANTVLFFITGQIMIFKILNSTTRLIGPRDVGYLIILYISIHVTRLLTIWVVFPVLQSVGYGCTVPDAAVMLYGGLRGAIGLALALIVETQAGFDPRQKDLVLFHTSGIVILTLLINASTVGALVNHLGLNKPPADSRQLLKGATDHIHEEVHEMTHKLKSDKNFAGANWAKVEELLPDYEKLLHIYEGNDESVSDEQENFSNPEPSETGSMQTADSFHEAVEPMATTESRAQAASKLDLNDAIAHEINTTEDGEHTPSDIDKQPTFMGRIPSLGDVLTQFREHEKEEREKRHVERRFIFVMKASFWGQYEKGLIGQDAVRVLVEAADSAIDENDLSTTRNVLKKFFRIPRYLKWMHNQQNTYIKYISERLLFGNLGFAIEIASAFVYAAEQAHEFAELLLSSGTVGEQHVKDVKDELDDVTKWISNRSHRVQTVYPEVHQAIQTEHATHFLLHQSKHVIEHLYHKGFLEEAEFGRVNALADHALNKLFRTGYSEFLESASDEQLFLANPLFADLSEQEKNKILSGAISKHLMPQDEFVFERRSTAESIFIITRGTVAVLERTDPGSSVHGGTMSDFMNSYWKEVETKGRNEMFEIWPVLHESPQIHSFRVTSENCSGFSVLADTLFEVAQSNHLFWEALWKTASVELVKYFFRDDEVFATFDLSHLENFMDDQDLEYVDHEAEDSLILVNTTCAILLNGAVLHMDSPGEDPIAAPVVLMENDVPYVPFEDCVVIYLDLNQRHAANAFKDLGTHTMRKLLIVGGGTRDILQGVDGALSEEHAHIPAPARAAGSMANPNNPFNHLHRIRSRTTIAAGGSSVPPPPANRPLDVQRDIIPDHINVESLDEHAGWEVVKILLDRYDYMEDLTRYARHRMKQAFQVPGATPRASQRAGVQPSVGADDGKEEDDTPKPLQRPISVGPMGALKKFARPSMAHLPMMTPNSKKRRSAQFPQGMPLMSPMMGRNMSAGNNSRVEDIFNPPNRNRGFSKPRQTIVMSKSYQRQTRNIHSPGSMDLDADGTAPLAGWELREDAETPIHELKGIEPQMASAIEMGKQPKKQGSILDVDSIMSDIVGDDNEQGAGFKE